MLKYLFCWSKTWSKYIQAYYDMFGKIVWSWKPYLGYSYIYVQLFIGNQSCLPVPICDIAVIVLSFPVSVSDGKSVKI